jgi:uncharacterized protein YjiS (DUF1127 family)
MMTIRQSLATAASGLNTFRIPAASNDSIAPTEARRPSPSRHVPDLRTSASEPRRGSGSTEPRHAVLTSAVKRWFSRIRSERLIRRGFAELMARDDRMLADIGLTRGDIDYAVRHGRLPRHVTDGVR